MTGVENVGVFVRERVWLENCLSQSEWGWQGRGGSNRETGCANTPTFSTPVVLHTHPPMKMEQTLCSETLGSCDRVSWANCEVREKTNKMQQSDVYYQHCFNMFRASVCPSSGEQRPCVTACGVLRWFCWMWLVAVVGRCVVGCERCEGYCRTVTHGLCSPEDGHNDARNMLRQCW